VPRLVLLVAIGAVVWLLVRRVQSLPPHKRRAEYMKLGIGAAVIIVIGLTLTGKMHWIGAALTGLLVAARQSLPWLIRLFPLLGHLRAKAAPSAGQQSTVSTRLLAMHLDHDSGQLSGEVLAGQFEGWQLDEMDREQLEALYAYCQREDAESVQLLEGYLQQRFGEQWNESAAGAEAPSPGGMSAKEAREILGVGEDASKEDIVAAHRRLMQKLHPDRGGSDYLAAKINQAKDFLLNH
jgi:hypothetical protein